MQGGGRLIQQTSIKYVHRPRSLTAAETILKNEQSEEMVGAWLEARGVRDQMVIATKYTSGYKAYALGATGGANHAGNHRKSMVVSLKDSLRKLKTDYVVF